MEKRTAIITGAGSGIGRATALRLAGKGIRLVLNSRDETRLATLAHQIGDQARIVCGDISDGGVTRACIQECLNAWQAPPAIFVASAGRGLRGTVIGSRTEDWDTLISTNVLGTMHQLREIGKAMLEQARPERDFVQHPLDIIVIGSSVGRNISPFNPVYGATKFATHGLTEALRRELAPRGIRVSLIEPGLVRTNFQETAGYDSEWFEQYAREVGPVLTADDIAGVIEFLVGLPGNVHLDNVSIRPTRQAYP
ncbi:SDR family NAD(P)-dependent oxidoreductase [Flavitalea sp. BT771]|uniref:SDR family NAD(P)-dependent oxidoreductase n=1 Tax=Flavitalea sp. BT771 TaxID=3063329 RepID=UPI0026E1265C|nr:SDR family NAD(P)-dependent oxidoreductase [Flavitalea sp. BT771]MDO6434609.1 SDR family NAD(P)-dependent oxidoreductase [Flavitalea sp. BT771]MDV6223509.1 SDR family NAD(P)-dependent oxidoreductase [Flavitalea sp. BT771]